MLKSNTYYLIVFGFLCLACAIYESVFYWKGIEPSEPLLSTASMLSLILVVMWVDTDSKSKINKVYRPYDFGFLIFLFWLPYLPYYLWRTRGYSGMVLFLCLVSLFSLSYIAQYLIYIFSNL
jgi:hypothetical protein